MGGYAGEILRVDLTSDRITSEELDMGVAEKFLGGRGLGVKILYDELEPRIDPLGNENKIIFASGPLTGTNAPMGGRYEVITKSPLTGTICDAGCGGCLGSELKYAGWDAVVIEGKANSPIYLWINDAEVELRSANYFWGKTTSETRDGIRKEEGLEDIRVASIGPAGENLVKYAAIINDDRAAARCGVGTVMGSKNLKAVAVRGSGDVTVSDPKGFKKIVSEIRNLLKASLLTGPSGGLHLIGTSSVLSLFNVGGITPVNNFQTAVFSGAKNIAGEKMAATILKGEKACFGCQVGCGRRIELKEDPYAGTRGEGPEYETIALMGANCGVDNLNIIVKANLLCNEFGLDTISSGNTIGFAMECFERGLIKKEETCGLDLSFGNQEAIITMLEKITNREDIGNLLAEGTKRAAEQIGEGSERFAVNVKGLELPGYEPRAVFGQALSYATSNRGGCHLRAWIALQEGYGLPPPVPFLPKKTDRFSVKDKPFYIKTLQDFMATLDSAILCIFKTTGAPNITHDSELLSKATGLNIDEEEFMKIGDRIYTLERAFNAKEGFGRKDDTLPARFLEEPMPKGPAKGKVVPLDEMLDEYYELRGLDGEGHPTAEKMREVGL